ncbi:2'-5' RNA ligase [Desulfosalsimonas propionicica]|uniref:2'-5' RNA ligase n=1 Tax=Desulfosalsimonas propionicica TaxID=332175 RepID=A0A7W0HLN0_9BACT|nr:2'-5' RNA ligase family protein [Desulfosalsimonas propionicica]MBA2882514.1 2'-5' RNA ligase [Desulfosalsimonas propionicica]
MPTAARDIQTRSVWNEFLSYKTTLATKNRDYSQWHKGREKFAVWTVGIGNEQVRSRFDAAKAWMEPFLFSPYYRQPHVTLLVCGFLTHKPRFSDDYSSQSLHRHLQDLWQPRIEPFEICIGGMNSFAAAPFLEVFDTQGGLAKIRRILTNSFCEDRTRAYVPHLTIGLYAGAFNTRDVAEKMAAFQTKDRISCLVDKITLSTYWPLEIAGPLSAQQEIQLKTAGK